MGLTHHLHPVTAIRQRSRVCFVKPLTQLETICRAGGCPEMAGTAAAGAAVAVPFCALRRHRSQSLHAMAAVVSGCAHLRCRGVAAIALPISAGNLAPLQAGRPCHRVLDCLQGCTASRLSGSTIAPMRGVWPSPQRLAGGWCTPGTRAHVPPSGALQQVPPSSYTRRPSSLPCMARCEQPASSPPQEPLPVNPAAFNLYNLILPAASSVNPTE
jgi:hypothetical protein